MYTWRHAEFVSRFNGPLFTLWFPFHSTFLNLVHIKASGGINFNEFPEKLLYLMKLRNNKRNINHKCNMQSVAKKWDGKMHYEPSHF